ncbi:MAG: hypothetical protein LLG06_05975 [Desulfobacteraceae bacterium]|nr:hypothetical protein [Desulfobacteraceae bacterium]
MTLTKSARTGTGLAIIGCLLSVAGCLIEKRPQTTIRLEMEQPRPAVMETPIPGALIQVDDTTKSISGGEPEAVRLDLREAVWCAVENNREIQVARYGPLQAFEALKSSQAAWDPSLVGSGSVGHTDRPTQSLLDTGDMLKKALIEDKTSA